VKLRWKLAVLAIGILPYVILQSRAIVLYRWWQPINIPLRFQSGHFGSPEFAIRETGRYDVLIEFDNKFSRDSCVFGFPFWDSAQGHFQPIDALDIWWQVLSEGRVIATGPIASPNELYVNRVARSIGQFDALNGHQYRVEVSLLRDPCGLDAANPHLIVESFDAYSEGPIVLGQAALFVALLVTAAVLISFVIGVLRMKYGRTSGLT
jgi:hypothetical protein